MSRSHVLCVLPAELWFDAIHAEYEDKLWKICILSSSKMTAIADASMKLNWFSVEGLVI